MEFQARTTGLRKAFSRQPFACKLEWCAGLALTLFAVFVHLRFNRSAGGLWRDEANTVALANLPTIGDIWQNLQFDSFPLFWMGVLRTWNWFGFSSDVSLRILGLCIGLAILGTIWFVAWKFRFPAPLCSLSLLAFSPVVVRYGDSLRAYGFGLIMLMLLAVVIWNFVQKPGTASFLLAAAGAIVACHTQFQLWVILFCFCLGGVAVAARKRQWKLAWAVLGLGMITLLTILPYYIVIRDASAWNVILKTNFNLREFLFRLHGSLSLGGPGLFWIWLILLITALTGGILIYRTKPEAASDALLFTLVSVGAGLPGYYIFLQLLSYPTQPWYYILFIALGTMGADILLGVSSRFCKPLSFAKLILVAITLPLSLQAAWDASGNRMTSVDLIGKRLEQLAGAGDVIVVDPWYLRVSFDRYYRGGAQVFTIPPVPRGSLHRFDLLKSHMSNPDQLAPMLPLLRAVTESLQSGHAVFYVGTARPEAPAQIPILPPAPHSSIGWSEASYLNAWRCMLGAVFASHSTHSEAIPLRVTEPVSGYEAPSVFAFTREIKEP